MNDRLLQWRCAVERLDRTPFRPDRERSSIRHRHTPMITTMHSNQNVSAPCVEVITSVQRRHRWSTAEKIPLVERRRCSPGAVSLVPVP
jgi:hypothetical protein